VVPRTLYPGEKVLAATAVYNEEDRVGSLAESFVPGLADEVVVVDDGSTDRSAEILRAHGIKVLEQPHLGLGASIKHIVRYARENGFTLLVVLAGNGKDDPKEIPRVLAPILEDRADYVQGSRFLPGGSRANTPLFRPRINIEQHWLDNYEYEYYVHWYAHALGYRVAEVPVSKTYPAEKGVKYSKIRPFTGWWRMLRPFLLLGLGLKK
jgi:dolichol-phosphate mannosyltransferase